MASVSSIPFSFMSAPITVAPSDANTRHTALPMPLPAPSIYRYERFFLPLQYNFYNRPIYVDYGVTSMHQRGISKLTQVYIPVITE